MSQDDLWADPLSFSDIGENKTDIFHQASSLHQLPSELSIGTDDSFLNRKPFMPKMEFTIQGNSSLIDSLGNDLFVPQQAAFQNDLWSSGEEPLNLLENDNSLVPFEATNHGGTFLSSPDGSDDDSDLLTLDFTDEDDITLFPSDSLVNKSDNSSFFQKTSETVSFESPFYQKTSSIDASFDISNDDLTDSLALLDIQVALLAEEHDELFLELDEESAVEEIRGRAKGFGGSQSLLYVDWNDGENAEQKALELLGYSKLKISAATRSFILQVARKCDLTNKKEKIYINQLLQARAAYANLPPDIEEHIEERTRLEHVIAQIEGELVQKMAWVAIKKAPQFLDMGSELDDVIQFGMLGVIEGVKRYDPQRSPRLLISVNLWVFAIMSRMVCDQSRLIQFPAYIHDSLLHIQKIKDDYELKTGETLSAQEVADIGKMSIDRLKQLEELLLWKIMSIQRLARKENRHEGYSFEDVEKKLICTEDDVIFEHVWHVSANQSVEYLLTNITSRERTVLELRLGLHEDGGEPLSLEVIGKQFKVTRERIRQIESKALKKIKVKLEADQAQKRSQEEMQRTAKEKVRAKLAPGQDEQRKASLTPDQRQRKIDAMNKLRAELIVNQIQRESQNMYEEKAEARAWLNPDQLQRKLEALNKRRAKQAQNQALNEE